MATITTPTVLDEVTARTAGEAWTINTGGSLTIKTDTRWHAKAPVSGTGSLGSISVNDGSCLIDATKVRWLSITGGSGTAAIGTTVTQGAVSGYFLGFWSALDAYPSTTIGTTGFIKFREVTGGTFSAGALSGITATATGADVPGWIEIVHDQSATITVPRLGTYTTRGDWFRLDDISGTAGQVIQTPTMNGGANTFVPAVWIETGVGTNSYEMYPSLYTWTNSWARADIGGPASEQDHRKKFVKAIGSGQVQIGEMSTLDGTYANITQASTYATVAHSGTYTWIDDVVTVYCSGTHYLKTGEQTGLDFTTGGATTSDGVYTVTVLDSYYFTVSLAGSGVAGNVTSRPFVAITFTNNFNNWGSQVLCDFTTGTGVDGTYTIVSAQNANTYWVSYPHIAALTSGNVTVYKGALLTVGAAHGLSVGNRLEISFVGDAIADGRYTVNRVPAVTTLEIPIPLNLTGGAFTITWLTGYVPSAGCKVRIPNIIGHQCVTTTRAVNAAPHGTIASRPEFATTSAGYVDVENTLTDWYFNIAQPYYFSMKHSATFDQVSISESATAFYLDDVCIGQFGSLDAVVLNLVSNFAGGYIGYVNAHRGNTPGASDHAVSMSYCNNIIINGLECGIIRYARNSGKPININICNNITINEIGTYNGHVNVSTTNGLIINHADICDRYNGYTNNTSAYYAVELTSSNDITISNITFGRNFSIPNCHAMNGLVTMNGNNRVKIRNCGTYDNPLQTGSWAINAYAMGRITNSSGNNNTVKIQEVYVDRLQSDWCATVNSDKNVIIENAHCREVGWSNARTSIARAVAYLNGTMKNVPGEQTLTGQASVYGTHWINFFNRAGYGMLSFCMNEPTPETAAYVTAVSGTPKWNSVGGVILPTIGNQVIWETSDWVKGTTFRNVTPSMTGGTIGNYSLTYSIDIGSGYSTFKALTGTNLSAEVIPATGFKFKLSITTTTNNTTAITFLRIYTFNDAVINAANPYPLDTFTLTLSGLVAGSDVTFIASGTETVISNTEDYAGTSFNYVYETPTTVDILLNKPGYFPAAIRNFVLESEDSSLPVTQSPDPSYLG